MKRLLILVVIAGALGVERRAEAANPNPFPDSWTCGQTFPVTNPAYCLRILNNGNLGTGAALELGGTSGRTLYVHSTGSPGLFVTESGGDVNTIALRGYNQGAGTGAVFSALTNDGGSGVTNDATRSGWVARNWSGTGAAGFWTDAQVWGGGWHLVSDPRTKRDFAANQNGRARILALKTYTYVLKADTTNTRRVGFDADQVAQVMPMAVHVGPDLTDKDGKTVPGMEKLKGIDLGAILAGLVETVKAQQKEIDDLKAAVQP